MTGVSEDENDTNTTTIEDDEELARAVELSLNGKDRMALSKDIIAKFFKQYKISERIINFLQTGGSKNLGTNLEEKIELGHIPIGFSDTRIWEPLNQFISDYPTNFKTLAGKITKTDDDIKAIHNELDALDKKKQQLISSLDSLTVRKNDLLEEKAFIDEIFLISSEDSISKISPKEIELTTLIDGFSSIKENNENPKLSLIFNAFGMSSDVIKTVSEMDCSEFLAYDPFHIFSLLDSTLEEKLDVCFIHLMLSNNVLPKRAHCSACVVCSCESPQDLVNLFVERNITAISKEFLQNNKLNGPRILSLSPSLLISEFGISRTEIQAYIRVIGELKRLHFSDD